MERIGRYQIMGELGRGAMGIVYRALDTTIGRTVAIKTIRLSELSDASEQSRLRDRLLREAQSAGILSHPGIVTIYDVGEENGIAYVAMECVNGPTLDRLLATDPPDGKLVLNILTQTAAALDYAHKKGIVHRDIKPANIMIDDGPLAKIADFGVARFQSHQLTQAGAMVGTPSYMSPEQIQGKQVDGKSDQFSLGVIAYELLTGEKPFTGDSLASLAYAIVNEEPQPAQRLNPTLDWPVDTVLKRVLSKQPEDRYPTSSDFVFALENACRSCKKWKPLPPGDVGNQATLTDKPAPRAVPAAAAIPKPKSQPERRFERTADDVPAPLRVMRVIGVLALAGVLIGAALVGAFQYLMVDDSVAEETPELTDPEPETPQARKPSAIPELPGDPGEATEQASAEEQDGSEDQPQAEAPKPAPSVTAAAKARATSTAEASETRIVTNPPGAFVVVDGTSQLSCETPCTLTLSPGRHTLAATMAGYRRTLRIFETPGDSELFVNLDRSAGTLIVHSEPSGATILIDGQQQAQRTPAMLNVPTGQHTIELVRNGERQSRSITIKDSAITNVSVTFSNR